MIGTDVERLEHSIYMANIYHTGQMRKYNDLPYIVHATKVMYLLVRWGIRDHCILSAAVLHGSISDGTASHTMIVEEVGAEIADLVQEFTAQKPFKELPPEVMMIKLADILCNASDIGYKSPKYLTQYWKKCDKIVRRALYQSTEDFLPIRDKFGRATWQQIRKNLLDLDRFVQEAKFNVKPEILRLVASRFAQKVV